MPKHQTKRKFIRKNQQVSDQQITQPDDRSVASSSSTSTCPPYSLPKIKKFTPKEIDIPLTLYHKDHLPLLFTQDFNRLEIQCWCEITLEEWKTFMQSEKCANVSSLEIRMLDFADEAISALVESQFLTNLKELSLIHVNISPETVGMIANSSKLLTLEALKIQNCPEFGPKGVKALIQSPYIVNLKHLQLINTFIGDEGLKALCGSKNFQQVEKLNLQGNLLSAKTYEILKKTKWIKGLEHLVICGNGLAKSLTKKKALSLKDPTLAAQLVD